VKEYLKNYKNFAEKILVLNEDDLKNDFKKKSHTAVTTYHSIFENYGLQRYN
jgi:hypothetical protein